MVGGVFGFLPVLGFWMLPLGAALIALDLPFTRKRIEKWMETLQQKLAKPEFAHSIDDGLTDTNSACAVHGPLADLDDQNPHPH